MSRKGLGEQDAGEKAPLWRLKRTVREKASAEKDVGEKEMGRRLRDGLPDPVRAQR
jgi:hypothetical protein